MRSNLEGGGGGVGVGGEWTPILGCTGCATFQSIIFQ